MNHTALRRELIYTAQQMNPSGINQGRSGNVSCRVDDGMLVTPSSVDYEILNPSDIVHMQWDGSWSADNDRKPSSEWRMHLDILKARDDINGVVHTHATYCTALSVLGKGIPAFHYMVAMAGGNDIRCAPYFTFGTQALSEATVTALENRRACLLANHGMVSCGDSLDSALALAIEVETMAKQYSFALQLGEPNLLSDEEMQAVLEKFSLGYGYGTSD